MKILLLGFAKMKYMPYASFYLEAIDYKKNEVDIVYWNRDLKEEDLSGYDSSISFFEFKEAMNDSVSKFNKLHFFYKYRKFVKKIIRQKQYDHIVCLHTFPGLLILDSLLRNYKRKYILDYRDSTFESNAVFGKLVKTLSRNSILTFTSSDAFRQFLPKNGVEIITSHNILSESLLHRDDRKKSYVPHNKIRISFWGFIRHYDHNRSLIDRLANDSRFELHYYGRECTTSQKIRQYITTKRINNVFLHGEYIPSDRYKFINQTDLIHNSYFDANTMLAMGNKYYDGVIFRIPQLCMPGSYMAKRCINKGVGFAVDPNDTDFANKVFIEYSNIDTAKFEANCDAELSQILNEFNYGKTCIKQILNN